jgi:hypothetical protein
MLSIIVEADLFKALDGCCGGRPKAGWFELCPDASRGSCTWAMSNGSLWLGEHPSPGAAGEYIERRLGGAAP